MREEMRGLFLAIVLSIVAIFITNRFFPGKTVPAAAPAVTEEAPLPQTPLPQEKIKTDEFIAAADTAEIMASAEAVRQDSRIHIKNASLTGSIRVKGARFDNLLLEKYKQTLENDSPDVELFAPAKTAAPYYAEFGWLSSDSSLRMPDHNTVWTVRGGELTPETPVVLEWNNGQGLKFIRKISLDADYMFNIQQDVENDTERTVTLYPYGLINRKTENANPSASVVHEGLIGVVDNNLKEIKYKDLIDEKAKEFKTAQGWAGFSDRYWFTAFILEGQNQNTVKFSATGKQNFQTDYVGAPVTAAPGSVASNSVKLFAGAKEIKLLDKYTQSLNIPKFDLAVDFGWYYFLTKPFFYILDFLYNFIGNMGWAILLFAALLRLVMFPIANKSYDSMSKMKKIQPKIKELQERYGNDKMKLQQETLEMYRREKINPAAGCLPMFIQIPVFFSLYKVLNIAIEIRHAPFIGWIKDLSAPDPLVLSTILHFPVPSLLDIGVWPIIMGITMYVQQKLNPAPTNKDQARMFALMPLIFTFMLGHFASGLVIYWTLSNILSIIQQKAIMRKNGVK
ncbi:MAG: membrane protein insertase YidC [Alphaproteobacteria bacterium]|jgi:membrane protein insertase, YidC/Oxa1 family